MSCAPPPPWYEELAALAVEPKLLVSVPAERIAELERRVVADSHNWSSPPPSSGGGPAWAKAVIDLLIEAADAVADALPGPLPAGGVVPRRLPARTPAKGPKPQAGALAGRA
ncbi:hypothetical protein [Streptomyces hygroscopicus]|uniref:hypothetical protein n=1 Tax=Streptomyces hygroscopicus TaxID=1912 RepID=UPI0036B8041B